MGQAAKVKIINHLSRDPAYFPRNPFAGSILADGKRGQCCRKGFRMCVGCETAVCSRRGSNIASIAYARQGAEKKIAKVSTRLAEI